MKRKDPFGAALAGAAAGAVGSLAQEGFFAATSTLAPEPPKGVFRPPDPLQREEQAVETVARRAVEGLLQRGPLAHKHAAGEAVHYAFGAAWGSLYGLLASSYRPVASPLGALAFGSAVWLAGDNVILPAFRLSAWPQRYPPRTHVYAFAAHLVYGAAVWGAYRVARRCTVAELAGLMTTWWATRRLPSLLRTPVLRAAWAFGRTKKRVESVGEAFRPAL